MRRTTIPHPETFVAKYMSIIDMEDEEMQRLSLTAMTLTMLAFVSMFIGLIAYAHLS